MKYDIIIVGSGPAGMTAAIYGQRSGKTTLLLDEKGFGGQIVNTPQIENYPGIKEVSGMEVLEKDLKVMDLTAATLCRDNNIAIHVFALAEDGNVLKAVCGEKIGTIIE